MLSFIWLHKTDGIFNFLKLYDPNMRQMWCPKSVDNATIEFKFKKCKPCWSKSIDGIILYNLIFDPDELFKKTQFNRGKSPKKENENFLHILHACTKSC